MLSGFNTDQVFKGRALLLAHRNQRKDRGLLCLPKESHITGNDSSESTEII